MAAYIIEEPCLQYANPYEGHGMITLLWAGFLALGALLAFTFVTWLFARYPVFVALTAGVYVLIAWEVPHVPSLTTVAGTQVYFLDVLAAALTIIAVTRFPQLARRMPFIALLFAILTGVLMLSLMRGLPMFGLGTASNDFRSFFYLFAMAAWAASINWSPNFTHKIVYRGGLILGWLLALVFVFHAATNGLGGADQFVVDSATGTSRTARPLVAGQAMMLLLCASVAFTHWLSSHRSFSMWSGTAFLTCVVLCQHRTVWAAAAAVLIVLVVTATAGRGARLVAFALGSAMAVALTSTFGLLDKFFDLIMRSAESTGTYEARQTSWQALLQQSMHSGDAMSLLFGLPMGSGYGRFEGESRWVEFAPHNWYLTLFLRIGIVGLLAFLLLIIVPLAICLIRRQALVTAVLAGLVVFGWGYSWPWYAGIVVGWAIQSAFQPEPRSRQDYSPTPRAPNHPKVAGKSARRRSPIIYRPPAARYSNPRNSR